MSFGKRLIWFFYLIVLLWFISHKAVNFFYSDGHLYLYFLILKAFNPSFRIAYALSFLQIIFNFLHCLPLILFIYRKKFLPAGVWQVLLIAKIILDISGNSYAINYLTSLYYMDPVICILSIISALTMYIPLYIACFQYAFRQKKLFGK